MFKLILFLLYIFLILTVLFAERKTPTEALLWVFVLICLPYAGAVLYLIFGSTIAIRLTAFFRKKRMRDREPVRKERRAEPEACLSDEDRQVIRFNRTYNKSRLTSYDSAEIFTDGIHHYERLFGDIAAAEDCIYVEFYTIHHDRVGKALVRALTEKAKEGVKVLVLCDFIANLSTPQRMFAPLTEAGGRVIRIKPYLTHYRSHRKIVTIDHKVSYIGGMNIGEQYANMAKVKNPWRDTQVRLEGACTDVLDEYFLTDWLCAVRRKDWESTVEYIESLPEPNHPHSRSVCQFIIGGADTSAESVKMCCLSMIRTAKKRIRIQTPYFIPDPSILDALKTAMAGGVEVELMIPGIKASFFLDPVTTYYCGELLRYGAKVRKYKGYIHAKTMTVDDELCCIGSVNMDMRSLMVDDEVCGVFYTNALVKHYNALFREDCTHCTEYTWEEFENRGKKEKLAEGIFLIFAPLM